MWWWWEGREREREEGKRTKGEVEGRRSKVIAEEVIHRRRSEVVVSLALFRRCFPLSEMRGSHLTVRTTLAEAFGVKESASTQSSARESILVVGVKPAANCLRSRSLFGFSAPPRRGLAAPPASSWRREGMVWSVPLRRAAGSSGGLESCLRAREREGSSMKK